MEKYFKRFSVQITLKYYDYVKCSFDAQSFIMLEKSIKNQLFVLQEMAMRKVTRTQFEEDDDDMVGGTVWLMADLLMKVNILERNVIISRQ